MFEYLKAEAYSKLRREIINALDIALAVNGEYSGPYYSGRMSAFAEVFNLMNAVDNALSEEMEREAEKEDAYYSHEKQ